MRALAYSLAAVVKRWTHCSIWQGLVANRLEGDYYRIVVDSGNYREKREKTLENLAKKLSSQVIRTGRSVTLEPMNPYERRVIHATIQGIDGVTSSSVGEEPSRRVVISSTNRRKKAITAIGRRKAAIGAVTVEAGAAEAAGRAAADMKNVRHAKNMCRRT